MADERDYAALNRPQRQIERRIHKTTATAGRKYVEGLIARGEVDALVGQSALLNVRMRRTLAPIFKQVARKHGLVE